MKKYKLYFEVFGKKMVTTIKATSLEEAQQKVKNRISFIKTEELPEESESLNDIFTRNPDFKDIFGGIFNL